MNRLPKPGDQPSTSGFTMIELMVTLALLGMVGPLFAPPLALPLTSRLKDVPGCKRLYDSSVTPYIDEHAREPKACSVEQNLRMTKIAPVAFATEQGGTYPNPTPEEIAGYLGSGSTVPAETGSSTDSTVPSPTVSPSPTQTRTTQTPGGPSSTTPVTSAAPSTPTSASPSASPTPTASSSATSSPSSTPSQSSTASASPSASPSPTSQPTPSPSPTPTFTAAYVTYNGNPNNLYEVYINVKVTPTDLAGKTINGLRIDLGGQGFSTPYEGNTSINSTGWGATTDWTCQLGSTSSCQGTTPFQQGSKSIFAFFFNTSLAGAPATLMVTLLSNSAAVTTLTVPLQSS